METEQTILTPESSEKIAIGLVREWYLEHRIVMYRLSAVTPETISTWAEDVWTNLQTWDKDKPYLALHDLSQPGVSLQFAAMVSFDMMNIGITLEGRMRIESLFDAEPHRTARVAVNFNLSLSGQTNRTLMNFLNREHPAIRYKTFYNRTKCFKWLKGDLLDTSETKSV